MIIRGNLRIAGNHQLWLMVVVGFCAVTLAGCKNSGGKLLGRGESSGGQLMSRGDPLLGGARIPPQDLPVPGKDGYGTREKKDPILGSPTGESGERAGKGDGKGSASRGASQEPYQAGPKTTNASLAGRMVPDDSELSAGERRSPVIPASLKSTSGESVNLDTLNAELKRFGAKWTPPVREGNQFVFRCDVPVNKDQPGLVRSYEGAGATPAAAVQQALDQIKSDQR